MFFMEEFHKCIQKEQLERYFDVIDQFHPLSQQPLPLMTE